MNVKDFSDKNDVLDQSGDSVLIADSNGKNNL